MTMPQIQDYLRTFDVQDRYDINGNGNFDEPDGVIDHFQIVHAGGDEAAGDPIYGQDAIWSHRWAAQLHTGCPYDVAGVLSMNIGRGGVSSGQTIPDNPTGICIYDYTIQPENGGLGVFAHEFGHDLGLPDLYDTSGNTGGAENSTGFWTLMSSGANIGNGRATTASATSRSTWVRGRSSSLAGSTTTSPSPATRRSTSWARPSTTRSTRRALFVDPARQGGHDRPRRPVRGAGLLLLGRG